MADGNRRYKSDKKLYKVSFKLSEEDKRLLEEGAKKAGMNISEYLRNLVRGGGNVDASFTTDRGNFIRQITGIATNVNQIAKVVNTQGYGYTRDILAVKQDLDAIWITDSVNHVQDKQIYEIAEEFLKHNKQILLSRHIQKETYDDLVQLVNTYSGELVNLLQSEQCINFNTIPAKLYDIYTPIIDIAGIGEKTDKFLLQLAVKDYLERQGYHTILVSSRDNSLYLDNVYSLPVFMNGGIPPEYKIILYNHFIKKIEEEEKPEVIIIGIPGEIMPISKVQPGHFGIHAFQLLNAVNPDFLIMSLYGNEISGKYVKELKQIMKYKFVANIDCFYLGNYAQDVFTVNRSRPIEYFLINEKDKIQLRDNLKNELEYEEKIYIDTEIEMLGQYIIDCLNENFEIEVL